MDRRTPHRNAAAPVVAREVLALALLLAAGALVLDATGVGCPIKWATGVSCPGCGLTRAWLACLHGHLRQALAYHPLFWSVPALLVLACVRNARRSRALDVVIACAVAAFIAVWLVRLLVPDDMALLGAAGIAGDVVNVGTPRWAAWALRAIG